MGNEVAQRAIEIDQNDAEAYVAFALIKLFSNQLDAAVTACRNALELNPNLAAAEGLLAVILSWRGDYAEAIVHAERSFRLSPRDNFSMWGIAQTAANFGAGNYEQSAEWAKRAVETTPEWPAAWRYLTASLSHLGRIEEARAARDSCFGSCLTKAYDCFAPPCLPPTRIASTGLSRACARPASPSEQHDYPKMSLPPVAWTGDGKVEASLRAARCADRTIAIVARADDRTGRTAICELTFGYPGSASNSTYRMISTNCR